MSIRFLKDCYTELWGKLLLYFAAGLLVFIAWLLFRAQETVGKAGQERMRDSVRETAEVTAQDAAKSPTLAKSVVQQAPTLESNDEVLKTAMAAYQPVRRLKRDFLKETDGDNYLDKAIILKGVQIMAMSSLDASVGRISIEFTEALNSEDELLKSIRWTKTRQGDPAWEELYQHWLGEDGLPETPVSSEHSTLMCTAATPVGKLCFPCCGVI